MNTFKTAIVAIVFLGVIYGVYQLVYAPSNYLEEETPIVDESGKPIVEPIEGENSSAVEMSQEDIDNMFNDEPKLNLNSSSDGSSNSGNDLNFDEGESGAPELNFSSEFEEAPEIKIDTSSDSNLQPPQNNGFQAPDLIIPDLENGSTETIKEPESISADNSTNKQINVPTQFENETTEIEPSQGGLSLNPPANSNSNLNIGNANASNGPESISEFPPRNDTIQNDSELVLTNPDPPKATASYPLEKLSPSSETRSAPPGIHPSTGAPTFASTQPKINLAVNGVDPDAEFTNQLTTAWKEASELIKEQKLRDALGKLSPFHNDDRLTETEQKNLLSWLDPLARNVIYSTENHLEPLPHIVGQNESLESIAKKYNVPKQLIYNVNRINIPNQRFITPGTKLKVVKGPFCAVVHLSKQTLTVFLDNLYAGRFPIKIGQDNPPKLGVTTVKYKTDQGQKFVVDNAVLPPTDPANPYGKYWMDIGGGASIHGAPMATATGSTRGSISLSKIDAQDVYGILSQGSEVKILR